jgi:Ca2+-binding EF-hand superfamily protein
LQSLEKDLFKIPPQIKDPDIIELISGILQNPKGKGWSLSKVINSSLIRRLRIAEGMTSKSTINDLDYNAKLILIGLAGTIKRNKLDLEELFKKFDSSGDMSIELDEFEKLLRVLDPKLSEIQIQRVFNLMDHDGSGSISFEELKELMGLNVGKTENGFVENKDMEAKIKKMMYVLRETINRNGLNINAIFSRYDDSGDMSLDSTEFYNLLRDIYPSIEEAMATYLFKKLDYDGSGDLGLNEFKSYVMEDKDLEKKLKDLEEKTQEAVNFMRNMMYGQKLDMRKLFAKADIKNRGKINEGEFKELILLIDNGITKEIIRNIFKKIDKDGSGFIEYEEFSNYLK